MKDLTWLLFLPFIAFQRQESLSAEDMEIYDGKKLHIQIYERDICKTRHVSKQRKAEINLWQYLLGLILFIFSLFGAD